MDFRRALLSGPPPQGGSNARPSVASERRSDLNVTNTGARKKAGTLTAAKTKSATLSCPECGAGFPTQAKLAGHISRRECGDRGKCRICGDTFPTFAGVRQHERRVHPSEYSRQLESLKPKSEAEIFSILSRIEASSVNGKFFKLMAKETGLTEHQIRHRREKPIYAKYLARARQTQSERARVNLFSAATTNKAASPPVNDNTDTAPQISSVHPSATQALVKSPPHTIEQAESTSNETHTPREAPLCPAPLSLSVAGAADDVSPQINIVENLLLPSATPKTNLLAGAMEACKRPRISTSPPEATPGKRRRLAPYKRGVKRCRSPGGVSDGDNGEAAAYTIEKAARRGKAQRVHESQTAGPSWQSSQETARSPRPIVLLNRAPSPSPSGDKSISLDGPEVPEDETISSVFRDHLIRARFQLPTDDLELRRLIDLALTGDQPTLTREIGDWLVSNLGSRATKRGPKGPKPTSNYGQKSTGRGQRASEYKKAQDLFARDRKRLAETILAGRSMYHDAIYPAVERLFGGILESASPPDREPIRHSHSSSAVFLPVTEDEVKGATANWHAAAPGTDGITVPAVRKFCPMRLGIAFSIILGRNIQLPQWAEQRTVLVPKTGDRRNAANWRPITIGSAVQRLLHRILHLRLRKATHLNVNQRGFTECDGTLANTVILDHYIQSRKSSGKEYNVVSLDVAKAFDTVSHQSIVRAMRRAGLDEGMVKYVSGTLHGVTTVIKVGNEHTRCIKINRGVKQGDPLSPFLFNLVLDELLDALNDKYQGGTVEGSTRVVAMAFADDLVVLADRELEVPIVLDDIARFMGKRGMAINPGKSRCVAAKPSRGNKCPTPVTISPFRIDGVRVPAVPVLEAFSYLGHSFGPTGINKPSLPNLISWLGNVQRAPLKPDQRLAILKQFLVPKLLYGLQNPRVDGKILKSADRLIRAWVKRVLHLAGHTNNSAIHASIRDGGLGVPELLHVVPQQLLARLVRGLDEAQDPVMSQVMQSARVTTVMDRLQRLGGLVPAKQLWRQKVAAEPMMRGVEQASDDRASRAWVDCRPKGWTGRDYVRAVQLRTGNLPTRGHPSNPPEERLCRGGCGVVETACHVLQRCHLSHGERIRRHNEVVRKLATHCTRLRWSVEEEPHVRHPNGTLFKPDLVVHKQDGDTLVVDAQVSWEGEDGMTSVWQRKERIYNNPVFVEAAQRRWPGRVLRFRPVIVGARGIWPRCNLPTEAGLDMTKQLKFSCVQSVLKWGSTIHGAFMRRAWASAGPQGTRVGSSNRRVGIPPPARIPGTRESGTGVVP